MLLGPYLLCGTWPHASWWWGWAAGHAARRFQAWLRQMKALLMPHTFHPSPPVRFGAPCEAGLPVNQGEMALPKVKNVLAKTARDACSEAFIF